MSAALQLNAAWCEGRSQPDWNDSGAGGAAVRPATSPTKPLEQSSAFEEARPPRERPAESLGFYRSHTGNLLKRYLYASMQIGRAPSLLGDPVGRGWASSHPIRTFEDAVIFVLDVERCLDRLSSLDQEILGRVLLQEYTQAETATMLGMSVRAMAYKFPQAVDRLTELLLASGLLVLPR